jgi:[CysO sulfur-carrier protein]-S-L-cysteine hydrolase
MTREFRPVLVIPQTILDAMIDHCLVESPQECCGILGGVASEVTLFYPLVNADQSQTTYNADARDLIRAIQDLRAREAEIVAIYHSHPRWPAIPSQTDLRANYYGEIPRIIISLVDERPVVRVWQLHSDSFEELAWKIVR